MKLFLKRILVFCNGESKLSVRSKKCLSVVSCLLWLVYIVLWILCNRQTSSQLVLGFLALGLGSVMGLALGVLRWYVGLGLVLRKKSELVHVLFSVALLLFLFGCLVSFLFLASDARRWILLSGYLPGILSFLFASGMDGVFCSSTNVVEVLSAKKKYILYPAILVLIMSGISGHILEFVEYRFFVTRSEEFLRSEYVDGCQLRTKVAQLAPSLRQDGGEYGVDSLASAFKGPYVPLRATMVRDSETEAIDILLQRLPYEVGVLIFSDATNVARRGEVFSGKTLVREIEESIWLYATWSHASVIPWQ